MILTNPHADTELIPSLTVCCLSNLLFGMIVSFVLRTLGHKLVRLVVGVDFVMTIIISCLLAGR
jgi:hypothetical protein